MANHPFNLVLLLSATFLLNLSLVSAQTQDFVYSFCGNTGNFTNTSTYSTNRNLLLSSLSSNISTSSERLFRNVTTGRNPDRIYGLYLCRGDNTPQFCQACVQAARDSAAQRCPNQIEAIIYYERCMLRYSNRSIVGVMQNDPPLFLYNTGNITDRNGFNRALGNLLLEVQGRASSGNKYATGEANFTTFQRIYALMQCTLDLSPTACNMCLEAARGYIPTCCDGRIGARVILPSCNLRYEIRPFYDASFSPRPPPPPPPRPPSPPPNSTSTQPEGNGKRSSRTIIAIVIPVAIALILFFIGVVCMCMRMRKRKTKQAIDYEDDITTLESLQFDFATVRAATDNFSDANKLGEGGFGAVYKGKLSDGQEIAVKRLSRNSGQGTEQFKNEVVLMAKLQHRNLVRLFGYSFEGEEKLLIYEFVPNSSLDRFIFDPIKRAELDWERRYNIIGGIARGLLYLHEDSRHRIIHRDLKAGNVLLDTEMNPKISDFGMARLVVVDETHANTNRVVGTYGYMSPEYAMHGQFSVKSDVYGFGVLLLEIVSGQRINTFHQSEQAEDLLSYAWRCWKDGTALQLLDPTLRGSCSASEVVRCIHIGLLCVQEDAADRPNMATVVLMLTSYSVTLVLPSKPAFFISSKADPVFPAIMEESCSTETNRAMANSTPWSVNEVSITEIEPR